MIKIVFSFLIKDSCIMCQGIWKEIIRCSKDYFLPRLIEVPLPDLCFWDLTALFVSYHCKVPKFFRIQALPERVQ